MVATIFTIISLMNICPNDFTITYTFVSGTVPPPYHYQYSVKIDSKGNGTISYTPDYTFDTTWTESFLLKKKEMRLVWKALKKNEFFSKEWVSAEKHPVGGSVCYIEIIANNNTFKIPAFPEDKENANKIIEEVKKLIPQKNLDVLSAKREKFIQEFKEKNK